MKDEPKNDDEVAMKAEEVKLEEGEALKPGNLTDEAAIDTKAESTEPEEHHGVADNEDDEDAENEEEVAEEKLWADVDKDLGDLLREVGPREEDEDEEEEEEEEQAAKSSEDDDESLGESGRYDRFGHSEVPGTDLISTIPDTKMEENTASVEDKD